MISALIMLSLVGIPLGVLGLLSLALFYARDLKLARPLLGVAGGLGAGRAAVAVAGHDDDVALLGGMGVDVQLEPPVAAELAQAQGHAEAVVFDHGHALFVELGDHRRSPGLALDLAQRLAYGPARVVQLALDEGLGDLG